MYEINKEAFGSFVASLRKEKGLTQKELADLLYISNKAVSKWETGVSIPDIAILVPLAEALGVTVTELLNCRRLPKDEALDSQQAEDLVKTVIGLSEGEQRKYRPDRWKRGIQLLLCTLTGIAEVWLMLQMGFYWEEVSLALFTMMLLMFIFGLYFCVFARATLPKYYDDNKICTFSDGFLQMNIPGVYFNNSNWPYIVRAGQLWAMIGLAGAPALYFLFRQFLPGFPETAWLPVSLLLILGGLFVPIFLVARKYEYPSEAPRPAYVRNRDWIWICICFALLLLLIFGASASGLTSTGSGSHMGWSEAKTLDSWNVSCSYLQGYRQRIINVGDDPAVLHIDATTEKGSLGLLITDSDDQVLFEQELRESATLDIPIPGKVRVRIIGDGLKGRFSMVWS